MDQILPRPVIPPEPDEPSGLGVFRWIVVGIIVAATFAGVLYWTMSVHRDRAEAVRMARPAEQLACEGSPLIEFSGKDVVVNRKYCSQEILNVLKQKPVRLPAWDPMFAEEE